LWSFSSFFRLEAFHRRPKLFSSSFIAKCVLAGYSLADLGLADSGSIRHWLATVAMTLLLISGLWLEARWLDTSNPLPPGMEPLFSFLCFRR
jgi:hypothetical protein